MFVAPGINVGNVCRPADCYVGYGGPARLLPVAVRRPLRVPTELDCKAECSRTWEREGRDAPCSSLSFRLVRSGGTQSNTQSGRQSGTQHPGKHILKPRNL